MAGIRGRIGWFLVWAIVYCDIGTSVYYTPGILYSSTKDLAGVFVALTLVAFLLLCQKEVEVSRRFVEGGGVVTVAAHAFSPVWGCIGGQLIVVDYLLTAAISATSGIYYIDSAFPLHGHIVFVTVSILVFLGLLNIVGIRESAILSAVLATAAFVVDLLVIGTALWNAPASVLARIPAQFAQLTHLPLKDALFGYAGAWLAFSGLESLSQISPAMRDTNRTPARGMLAVVFTVLLTSPILTCLATASLPDSVKARESERFISELGKVWGGHGLQIAVVLTASALLLFAANTAVIGNYHVQIALTRLKYLPGWLSARSFRFGTPHWAIVLSVALPALIVIVVNGNMQILGDMYAFGLLGAFSLKSLGLDVIRWREGQRNLWFWLGVLATAMVSVAFSINLVTKPLATVFGGLVAGTGLLVGLAVRNGWWDRLFARIPGIAEPGVGPGLMDLPFTHLGDAVGKPGSMPSCSVLIALRGLNQQVLDEARLQLKTLGQNAAYLIYVDEIPGMFFPQTASPTPEGLTVLKASRDALESHGIKVHLLWDCSHSAAESVAEASTTLKIDVVIVGASRRSAFWALLRGRFIRDLLARLPPEIRLMVVS
ncbi:MAG: universal stress protein [Candidatus Riflebacteria bacterium]|nr:universal stress protein [Candidatus Riflebacteria bacterium]